jgi:hypothetical protein
VTGRPAQLLLDAAAALDSDEDPLDEQFLALHEVTSHECANLAQQLAIGARLVAYGIEHPDSPEGQAVLAMVVRGVP